MKLKTFINRFILIAGLSLLQSCQFVTAQSDKELNFIPIKEWGTLGKDAPKELLEQFKSDYRETLAFDGIDPKRFLVHTHKRLSQKTIYVIDPRAECPEWGCPEDLNDYWELYAPFCQARQNFCLVMFYVEENGKFRSVFHDPFGDQGNEKGSLYAFSEQQQDGLPVCLEVKGYSVSSDLGGLLPAKKEDEHYVSRYCYDGQKYELNKIYTER